MRQQDSVNQVPTVVTERHQLTTIGLVCEGLAGTERQWDYLPLGGMHQPR